MNTKFSMVLELSDLEEYQQLYMEHSAYYKKTLWINRSIGLLAALIILLYDLFINPPLTPLTVTFLIFSLIWFVIYPIRQRSRTLKAFKQMNAERPSGSILGVHEVELTETGIASSYPGGRSEVYWTSIVEVYENERLLLLYNSAMSALVFPKAKIPADCIEALRNRGQAAAQAAKSVAKA